MLNKDSFIIAPETFKLIQELQAMPELSEFYLVGGTTLALLLGHRNSIDIDLFTTHSFDDKELFGKWDWEIATRKIEKNTILGLLKDFAPFVDWKYLINEVFTVENELAIDGDLIKIADCLTLFDSEKRKELWKDITKKFPFKTLFPIIEATKHLVTFDWDWDYISNHKQFPTDFGTINLFREKINWGIFSANESIQKKFSYRKDEWTYKEYFNYTLKN